MAQAVVVAFVEPLESIIDDDKFVFNYKENLLHPTLCIGSDEPEGFYFVCDLVHFLFSDYMMPNVTKQGENEVLIFFFWLNLLFFQSS